MMDWLFRDLDTTHGQEKVVFEASSEVETAIAGAKDALHRSRVNLAQALRGEEFDHEKIADAWVRQDAAVEKLRESLSVGLNNVHEALDNRQRERLADLIESGPYRRRWAQS